MSLKEQIVEDVLNVFQNEDEFAETITYHVKATNTDLQIVAIVFQDTDDEEPRDLGTNRVISSRLFISLADVPNPVIEDWIVIDGLKYHIWRIGENDRIGGTMMWIVHDTTKEKAGPNVKENYR